MAAARHLATVLCLGIAVSSCGESKRQRSPYSDTSEPLTAVPGDPEAGRRVFTDRERGHCLLCHRVAVLDEPFQGNLGPDLSTVGARLDAGQLRLRVVDPSVLNPNTVMPPYHRTDDLNQVGAGYRGRPILAAQEVEDLVTFLQTLTGDDTDA